METQALFRFFFFFLSLCWDLQDRDQTVDNGVHVEYYKYKRMYGFNENVDVKWVQWKKQQQLNTEEGIRG